MLKNYWSTFKKNANNGNVRKTAGKLKVSLISILTGLLLGLLIVWAVGSNPLDFMTSLLTGSFTNEETMNQFLIFSSVFMLAGLANAFAFKTGLFNIGVSGQMLAGGGLSMFLSLTVFKNLDSMIAIPLLIIVAMATAGVVGLFAGWVKTRFNVHEVVTTILLNWIIFYFIKWIFKYSESKTYTASSGDSQISNHHLFSDPLGLVIDSGWVVAIIIALSAVAIVAVLLKVTVFGKDLRITGLNKDGAEYTGINVKRSIILSMTISSAIAGLLGVVFYFGTKGFMPSLQTTLPTLGFDGIALALLAFNSPIGIIPVAFLYGLFKIGGINIPDTIMSKDFTAETVSLIFSIMIYAAAVSSLFYRFRPISYIIKLIRIHRHELLIELRKNQKAEMNQLKDKLNQLKDKKDIDQLKLKQKAELKQLREDIKQFKLKQKAELKQLREDIKQFKLKQKAKLHQLKDKKQINNFKLKQKAELKQFKNNIKATISNNNLILNKMINHFKEVKFRQKELLKQMISQKEIKLLRREQRNVLNDLHYKLLMTEIDTDYKMTKHYVIKTVKNKHKRDISFAKMALHTNLTTINKDKIELSSLKKQKRDLSIIKIYKNIAISYVKYGLSFVKLGMHWIYFGLSYAAWWIEFDKREKFINPIIESRNITLEHVHMLFKTILTNKEPLEKLNKEITSLKNKIKTNNNSRKMGIKDNKASSKKTINEIKMKCKETIAIKVDEYEKAWSIRQADIKKDKRNTYSSIMKEKEDFISVIENKILKGAL